MDKPRANYLKCLDDISKFKTSHLLLQQPLFDKSKKFIGVVDLIKLEKNIWNLEKDSFGIVVETKKLNEQDNEFGQAIALKEDLIGRLCEFDNHLSEQVFSTDNLLELPDQLIVNSIRKSTIKNQVVPVLMGSSFKNIGAQLLMNAITRYLPSPLERNLNISNLVDGRTSGFLFKIKYDKHLGALFFIRIYEGELRSNMKLLNYSKNKEERIEKIFKVFANEYTEVKTAKKGDIVALTGLQASSNGDFFVQNRETYSKVRHHIDKSTELGKGEEIILKGLKFPEPVIFCSVEAPSPSKEKELENALKCLQQEDPSFSVTFNKQTNQTILRGMGDLHLQIIKDRLARDFKLDAYYGKLQIAYLETLQGRIEHELQFNKVIRETKNSVYIKLILKSLSSNLNSISNDAINDDTKKVVKVIRSDENELYKLKLSHLNCIEKGVQLALETGPLLGNRVVNISAELHDFKTTSRTLDTVIISAAYECVSEAFQNGLSSFHLLEPIMAMEIEFSEKNYNTVLNELSNRRAIIGDLRLNDDRQILNALIPFVETINLSNKLRTVTSGNAHYTMQIDNYHVVNKSEESRIIEETKFGSVLN